MKKPGEWAYDFDYPSIPGGLPEDREELTRLFRDAMVDALGEAEKRLVEASCDSMESASFCGDMGIAAGVVSKVADELKKT